MFAVCQAGSSAWRDTFGGVVKQLLEDVQQCLVFRTQVCYMLFYISSVLARNCKPSGAKV